MSTVTRSQNHRKPMGQTSSSEQQVENNRKVFKLIQCIKKGEFNERSLDEFRTMLEDLVAWTDIAIEDIRVLQKEIKKCSFGLDKRNSESKFFVALENHLSLEEQRRPIDEQFPFVRTDLDQLSTITESMTKTTKFLDNAGLNRSRVMECSVNALFVEDMKKKGLLPIISIVSTDQSKYIGVELTVKKDEHILWDGMYAVIDCHGYYKQATIFLIETKEIANARDIFENENNLSDKVTKTLRYFDQRKQPSKGVKRPTDKDLVDIQKEQVASFLKVPLDGVENSAAPKIVVVYASGNMPSNVVEELVKLRNKFEGKVHVWSMECPRLTMCQINDV